MDGWEKFGFSAPYEGDPVALVRGIPLPEAYIAFMQEHDGGEGEVLDNWLVLYPLQELEELNKEFCFQEELPGHILIGSDGGGEMYGIDPEGRYFNVPDIIEKDLIRDLGKDIRRLPFMLSRLWHPGYPSPDEAEEILEEGERLNPGPWIQHSRNTALCAERIARACGDMDPEKAYVLALLHDIGRRAGQRHLGHVADGYAYMKSLGYDEAARICLTHSFHNQEREDYVGQADVTDEERKMIEDQLFSLEYDDYDKLIQLCDSLAKAEGIVSAEDRIADIEKRYGKYPEKKRRKINELKQYFEKKTGKDLYDIVMTGEEE